MLCIMNGQSTHISNRDTQHGSSCCASLFLCLVLLQDLSKLSQAELVLLLQSMAGMKLSPEDTQVGASLSFMQQIRGPC